MSIAGTGLDSRLRRVCRSRMTSLGCMSAGMYDDAAAVRPAACLEWIACAVWAPYRVRRRNGAGMAGPAVSVRHARPRGPPSPWLVRMAATTKCFARSAECHARPAQLGTDGEPAVAWKAYCSYMLLLFALSRPSAETCPNSSCTSLCLLPICMMPCLLAQVRSDRYSRVQNQPSSPSKTAGPAESP